MDTELLNFMMGNSRDDGDVRLRSTGSAGSLLLADVNSRWTGTARSLPGRLWQLRTEQLAAAEP